MKLLEAEGPGGRTAPALLSALLLILAQPPFHILPLAFLALVPLCVGLGLLPPGRSGARAAARMGLTFGGVFWGVSLLWVLTEVAPVFSWAYPGFGVLIFLLGGLSALFAWGVHALRWRGGIPPFLAVPVAWVAVEWIKAHFPLGLAFPWLGLAVGLTSRPELLGLAEWTGEAGVAFWLAGVNGLVAQAALAAGKGRRVMGLSGLALATALLPAALGVVRARTLELEPGLTVAVVGTNASRDIRSDPRGYASQAVHGVLQAVQDRSGLPPAGAPGPEGPAPRVGEAGGRPRGPVAADLVILPEATVPLPFRGLEARTFRQALAELARGLETPLLVGSQGVVSPEGPRGGGTPAPAGSVEGRSHGEVTNAAFLLSSEGEILGRYDKVRLVPAMEAGYAPGEGAGVLETDGLGVEPLICYESLFGGLARKARLEGADLLANLSSDVWFGEESSRPGSLFLHQHPAHLVLRAVENRIPVARAANGGYSFVLDPLGRGRENALPPEGGVMQARIRVSRGLTLFTRTGDLVGPGALLACLLLLARGRQGREGGGPA